MAKRNPKKDTKRIEVESADLSLTLDFAADTLGIPFLAGFTQFVQGHAPEYEDGHLCFASFTFPAESLVNITYMGTVFANTKINRRISTVVLLILILPPALYVSPQRAYAQTCNYYVNSVSGNDSNNGTSSSSPFQHLAAVPTVASGTTICLRRGSNFTDSLWVGINGSSIENNITVEDYGPSNLAMPMIDNSDVIPPSAWTAVGGAYPNLYQASVPGPGTYATTPYGTTTIATMFINMWECKSAPCTPTGSGGNDNSVNSTSTESGANVTLGSYYIPGQNLTTGSAPTDPTNLTIYMRASDGSNPATNGYTYTYSRRALGVEIWGSNATVTNIASKKGAYNDGNFVQFVDNGYATYNNIESDQGGKHNAYCTGGCIVNNSKFVDEYYSIGGMFVAFNGIGPGQPVTLNNDTFIDGVVASGTSATAFFGHNGDGSSYTNFIINGGLIEGVGGATGFSGGQAATNALTVTGLTCYNVTGCVTGSGTTTIANSQQYTASGLGLPDHDAFNVVAPNITLNISNTSMCGAYDQQAAITSYSSTYNNVYFSVASSTIYDISGSFANTGIYMGGASSTLSLYNTIIASNGSNVKWANLATSTDTYVGDYNSFVTPNVNKGTLATTTYTGLAAWQTATGQDAHSTTTGSGIGACTLPSFSISGPSSGYANATSSNFTVTPNKAYTGSVTFSLIGTAGAGLSPVVLNFNNSSAAQTFSLTPTATGTVNLIPLVNGATTSPTFLPPTTLTYTSNSSPTPVVFWTAPSLNSIVTGNVTITASSTESGGTIQSLAFYTGSISTSTLISSTTTPSSGSLYSVPWNTTSVANGTTTLIALSTDTSSNTASTTETVNVENPPAISSVASFTTASTATISWTTNEAATSQVNYGPTSGYGSSSSTPALVTSHSITLTSLAASTTYDFQILSTDTQGNTATTTDATVTIPAVSGGGGGGGSSYYTLNLTKSGSGTGTITGAGLNCGSSCSGTLISSQMLSLTATTDASSTFAGWSGDCMIAGTSTVCSLTMTGNKTATAIFNVRNSFPGTTPPAGSTTPASTSTTGSPGALGSIPSPISPVVSIRLINDRGTFYLIINNVSHGITDPGMLSSYGFDFSNALPATAADMALPQGPLLLPNDGALVKTAKDPTIYLISNQTRHGFTSASVFTGLGFKWSSVLVVTAPELDQQPLGNTASNASSQHLPGQDINKNGTIYYIGSDNQLHGYPSLATYNSWHVANDFSTVVPANAADTALPVGGLVSARVLQ
jgi:hypothetical protein